LKYFRLNIGDYLSDTKQLSFLEHGIYINMIIKYYHDENGLPADESKLYRELCIRTDDEKDCVSYLTERYFYRNRNRLLHRAIEKALGEYREKSMKARSSANKRWGCERNANALKNDANAMLTTNHKPLTTNHKKEKLKKEKPCTTSVARFNEFWELYPVKKGKKVVQQKWRLRKLDNMADKILEDVAKRLSSDASWKDGFIPNPATYINQDRWEDEIDDGQAATQQKIAYQDPTAQIVSKLSQAQDDGLVLMVGDKVVKFECGYLKDTVTDKMVQAYSFIKGGGKVFLDNGSELITLDQYGGQHGT